MKTMYATRDFNDAGTGRSFARGDAITDVSEDILGNYKAASLVTDENPNGDPAPEPAAVQPDPAFATGEPDPLPETVGADPAPVADAPEPQAEADADAPAATSTRRRKAADA